ncbi:MAG: carbohydrate ABC transporter permease, partial [Planctomycetota bacterium]
MKLQVLHSPKMSKVGLYIFLFGLVLFSVFPLLWVVSVSLMPSGESNAFPPPLLPSTLTLDHYVALFTHMNMGRYWLNSLFISLSVTAISLILNSMAGYAFA